MIVCIDCFKLFQTISNKNKTCNGQGSQSESANRTWHHAETSRRKNVFCILFVKDNNRVLCCFHTNKLQKRGWMDETSMPLSHEQVPNRQGEQHNIDQKCIYGIGWNICPTYASLYISNLAEGIEHRTYRLAVQHAITRLNGPALKREAFQ